MLMHTRIIDNCCITLAQRLEYQLATILYLIHSRKRPLKKSEHTWIILLRSRLKYLNFEIYIDFSDAACGKYTEYRGYIKSQYILYWALPAYRINGLWNRPCVLLLNYFAYRKISLSLKFANRTVPVLITISWKSIIISRWRACKQVKSAIHLSSTRFICVSKHSLPVWSSIFNGKRKFYRAILEDKRKKSGYGGIMPGIVFDSATTISELSTFLSLLLSPFNLTFIHLKKKHFSNY